MPYTANSSRTILDRTGYPMPQQEVLDTLNLHQTMAELMAGYISAGEESHLVGGPHPEGVFNRFKGEAKKILVENYGESFSQERKDDDNS